MIRVGVTLAVLVGCSSSDTVLVFGVSPYPVPRTGAGLVETLTLVDEGCQDVSRGHMGVSCPFQHASSSFLLVVSSGPADVGSVTPELSNRSGTFPITALAAGTATIAVSADNFTTMLADGAPMFDVDISEVAETTMVAQRPLGSNTAPLGDVSGPVQVLTDSNIAIGQTHQDLDGNPLPGLAPLVLDAALPDVSIDPSCNCVVSGETPGQTRVHALSGSLELDVIDPSAISAFTIDGALDVRAPFGRTATAGDLLPSDASGRTIVGRGPDPTVTIANPTIVQLAPDLVANPFVRELTLEGHAVGTTTLDITWGGAHETFSVSVVAQ